MGRRILVIDDEQSVVESVRMILQDEDCITYGAQTGKKGLSKSKELHPDLIILDLNLPDIDGIKICEHLRKSNKTFSIPIIMLTARDNTKDIKKGLETGADDYITKPFDVDEFSARVKALFRRIEYIHTPSDILTCDDIVINIPNFSVTLKGKEISLTQKEFKLLCVLIKNKNKLLSQQFLYQEVWGFKEQPYGSFTLQAHISNLREKMGPSIASRITVIEGKGYKLKS
ncbi:MAG: hypothetical protein A2252_08200 [Elusimicrobia bacterium RIFOXYA2_FULL_39_19]|nr:MAG: hypothetical protein A2252_08200 [Elusimicrobia bacterium RIFOXYA2_FULL_39_19]